MAKLQVLALAFCGFALSACTPSENTRQQWAAMAEDKSMQLSLEGERWRTLYQAGDWEALRALYTDDAVLMTQGQPKIEGADNIVAFLQRIPNAGGTVQFQFENEEVHTGEGPFPDFGFVTAKYMMTITFPGQEPVQVAGRSFLVYKWEGGEWKLWRDIDNLAPDASTEEFAQ
ncbi:YybH family protein [Erythrobacter sp. HA6-11]